MQFRLSLKYHLHSQVDFYSDRFVGTNFATDESYADISRSMGGQVKFLNFIKYKIYNRAQAFCRLEKVNGRIYI